MDTKKLRQKILDLAIHGKLVPQDPNDEPASVLLERISKEKERLIKEGKIKRSKQTASLDLSPDDVPFELPEGWCWVNIKDVTLKITDGTHHSPISYEKGDYLYITAKNIKDWGIDLSEITYVDETIHREIYSRCNPEFGDILYIKDGATTGVVTINTISEPFSLLSSVALIKPSRYISNKFLLFYLQSSLCRNSVRDSMKGVGITRITLTQIEKWNIPLPPLAEQKRIVSAVEQWMSVIDVLENNGEDLRQSIDKAKSKILDLAVRGKLVPQDSNDEPASDLLKRLGISPDNCPCDDLPFELPNGWCWTCMEECNKYKSVSVDPTKTPNNDYELYSVPTFETNMPEFVKGKEISSSKKGVLQGDVLLCKINPHLNRVWIVSHYERERICIASSEWIVFRNESLDAKYLIYCFQSPYFKDLMLSNVSGVGGSLMRAQPESVKKYLFPLPPLAEQHRIVAKIEQLYSQLDEIESSLQS